MITLNDFTTSADTNNLTTEQEQTLLEMAQFLKADLNKNSAHPCFQEWAPTGIP